MPRRVRKVLWGRDAGRPYATIAIGTVLIATFVLERRSGSWQHEITNMRHTFGWSMLDLQARDWWRLVTPAFLHSDTPSTVGPLGTEHLVANLLALALFAPRVEGRRGSSILVPAFLALHVAAFSVWAITRTPGTYFGVGASGAIVALAVTAIVDAGRDGEWPYVAGAALFAIVWWWPSGATSSNQVHVAGAVAGLAFGLMAAKPWLALGALALAGALITTLIEPRLPAPPHKLACPDGPYAWTGGPPTTLLVRNLWGQAVRVFWTRPDGTRVLIAPLGQDDYLVERSYVGHRFTITNDRGSCLDVVEASANRSTH